MKTVNVTIQLYWTTSLEVPDDFELNEDTCETLYDENVVDFDYLDGGLLPSSAHFIFDGGDDMVEIDI